MKRTVALFLLSGIFAGCVSVRYTAVPDVGDAGPDVATRYKYCLAGYKVGSESVAYDEIKASLEKNHPNVFANDGLPFVINEVPRNNKEVNYVWTAIIGLCSAFTLPIISEEIYDVDMSVTLVDSGETTDGYTLHLEKGSACTLFSPIGAFFWHGAPDVGKNKGFYGTFFNESLEADNRVAINRLAIGYGAAIRLKELETAGKIDPLKRKPKIQPVARPSDKPESVKQPSRMNSAMSPPAVPESKEIQDRKADPVCPLPDVSKPVQMFELENISL